MNFKEAIGMLMEGHRLQEAQAYQLMRGIGEGAYNEAQNAALIIALSSRDVALEEVQGFRKALLELSVPAQLEGYDTVDLCGTGGDGKNTFNISTLSSFVVAGAGYLVAKHGNYGVSSISGSSNVLETLGYRFSNEPDKLKRELETYGITFLHAPLFHPALKNVGMVRKQMGIKTVFNIMGPLVNPARTPKQFAGTFNLKLARLYHYLLQQDGKEYVVVHATDGYDEISLTGEVQYYSSRGEKLFAPEEVGMNTLTPESLFGGDTLEEAADIFTHILKGNGTDAQRSVIAANAGAAIQCFEKEQSLEECMAIAQESLDSGKALEVLTELMKNQ